MHEKYILVTSQIYFSYVSNIFSMHEKFFPHGTIFCGGRFFGKDLKGKHRIYDKPVIIFRQLGDSPANTTR